MPPKGLLSALVIEEIAFCERGMNPRADMVIWKAKRKRTHEDGEGSARKRPRRPKIRKEEDEPGTFGDHFEDARAMEIDAALDRRLHALLAATTEIMRSDGVDREALILAAVNDYAEAMNRDVPELFAGRLAKMLASWDADGDQPDDDQVRKVVKEELELVGLAGEVTKGENMDWLTKLSKEERAALDLVLAGTDPAEFFKGFEENQGAFVAALLKRAVEATTVDAELAKTVAELTKARADSGTDEGFEEILKSIDDPAVKALVELQRSKISKQGAELTTLQKEARTQRFEKMAGGFDCLPNEGGALVEALDKAEAAGILDTIQKVLTSANAQAKVAKQLEELGVDTIPGEGAAGSPQEADEALMAKAVEIQKAKPDLSIEQAYAKACDQHPKLYAATRTPATPVQ